MNPNPTRRETFRNPETLDDCGKCARALKLYNKDEMRILQAKVGDVFRRVARLTKQNYPIEALTTLHELFWTTIPLLRDCRITSAHSHLYLCRAVKLWQEKVSLEGIDYRDKEKITRHDWAILYIQDRHERRPTEEIIGQIDAFRRYQAHNDKEEAKRRSQRCQPNRA